VVRRGGGVVERVRELLNSGKHAQDEQELREYLYRVKRVMANSLIKQYRARRDPALL
jgi:hypothetical protein